jgi:hypothetical protein
MKDGEGKGKLADFGINVEDRKSEHNLACEKLKFLEVSLRGFFVPCMPALFSEKAPAVKRKGLEGCVRPGGADTATARSAGAGAKRSPGKPGCRAAAMRPK